MKRSLIPIAVFFCFAPSALAVQPRVIGGQELPDGSYPWVVSIEESVGADGRSAAPSTPGAYWQRLCSASVIAERWILSAAHCATPDDPYYRHPDRLRARFLNLAGHPYLGIERLVRNAAYNDLEDDFVRNIGDLMLLKLADSSPTPAVDIATTPEADQEGRADSKILGYGLVSDMEQVESVGLKSGDLQIASDQLCSSYAHKGSKLSSLYNLCRKKTQTLQPPQGIGCYGDSGGPIIINRQPQPILAGVESWGGLGNSYSCWLPGTLDIYVRVSTWVAWISRNTGINFTGNPEFDMSKAVGGARITDGRPLHRGRFRLGANISGANNSLKMFAVFCRRGSKKDICDYRRAQRLNYIFTTAGRKVINMRLPGIAMKKSRHYCIYLESQAINSLGNYSHWRVQKIKMWYSASAGRWKSYMSKAC